MRGPVLLGLGVMVFAVGILIGSGGWLIFRSFVF